jgi:predicted Zn-ribbon and HTH transcriptional regulator
MKKRIKRKHKHIIVSDEPCSNCGYQEGYCKGCEKMFGRIGWKKKWEEI